MHIQYIFNYNFLVCYALHNVKILYNIVKMKKKSMNFSLSRTIPVIWK